MSGCAPFRDFFEHPLNDEPGVDRHAVIVQQGHQFFLIGVYVVDQQCTKLRVTILLNHVYNVMFVNEITHRVRKRECFYAAIIEADIF